MSCLLIDLLSGEDNNVYSAIFGHDYLTTIGIHKSIVHRDVCTTLDWKSIERVQCFTIVCMRFGRDQIK